MVAFMVETKQEAPAYTQPLTHNDVVDRYWLSYPHGHPEESRMVELGGPTMVRGPAWSSWDDARVMLSNGLVVMRFQEDGGETIFHRFGEMEAAWWPTPVRNSVTDIYRPKALR